MIVEMFQLSFRVFMCAFLYDYCSTDVLISDLVLESIESSVLCIGLLYDQLATAICSCSTIDTTFLVSYVLPTLLKLNVHLSECLEIILRVVSI